MITGKLYPQGDFKANCWVKAYETTLTEAATSLTISGLTGDTDKEYRLEYRVVNGYDGDCGFYVYPNNDTAANCGYQYIGASDTAIACGRGASGGLAYAFGGNTSANAVAFGIIDIQAKSGYVRTFISKNVSGIVGTAVQAVYSVGQSWNNTADELTSLVVWATEDDGLGVGTNIILWEKVSR